MQLYNIVYGTVKNKINLQTRRKEFNGYLFNLMEVKFLLLLSTVTNDFPFFVEMFQFSFKIHIALVNV